jgi:hypothetical protein
MKGKLITIISGRWRIAIRDFPQDTMKRQGRGSDGGF